MPLDRWKGFIKDYDGGTMMECYIHPSIDYANISEIIRT
jgi:histone acetyltransferase